LRTGEVALIVAAQILEAMAMIASLVLVMAGRPWSELLLALGLLYLVHVGEFWAEWRERRLSPTPASYALMLYLIPGAVLLRRIAEFVASTLFVRLYLVLIVLLLLVTLPLTALVPGDRLARRVGMMHDLLDRAVEPLLDALLRAYNAISLNPHAPGETALVLAIPMPFREKLL
jgi:hypothetical protein